MIRRAFLALALGLSLAAPARADKVDDAARALLQDPAYKVRVQSALLLGKFKDKRGVPALIQALKDDKEPVRAAAADALGRIGDRSASNALLQASNDPSDFVSREAKKALEKIASAPTEVALPGPRAGARFYVAIGFQGKGGSYGDVVRQALARELQKLPDVTLSVPGGGEPSAAALSSRRLQGFIVDGSIERLSASRAGGQQQIDCDLKAYVATFPDKSIKMMTTEGASLQTGSGPSEEQSGKKDCLTAAVESVREDVGKFLRTVQ